MSDTLTVTYSGKTTILTAVNNCVLNYTIAGAGGGAGGADSHTGSDGLSGQVVSGSYSLKAGEQIAVTVGQGGRPGGAGGGAAGGVGGSGLIGYAGGQGGKSGSVPTSGSGGGGGGATVLHKVNPDPTFGNPASAIAIAAGGGGGGGGGDHSYGYIQSASSYGQTPMTKSTYSSASTNNAYCGFLNSYGIWNGDGHYVYEVLFPTSGTYTFQMSADNYAYMWLDNGTVNGNDDYIGATPNGDKTSYNTAHTFTHYVTAGWHTIDIYAYNYGYAASVAASVYVLNSTTTYMWTTRDPINALSIYKNKGRGGHGQDRNGDHGGPGGGGGGLYGGMGGIANTRGDYGSPSGSTGYNYIPVGGAKGAFAGHTINTNYVGGGVAVSRGADNASSYGKDGIAIFSAGQTDVYVRSSITTRRYGFIGPTETVVYWQPINHILTKISSAFQEVKEVYVRSGGVWKRVFGYDIPTSTTANTITTDNISGKESADPPPPEPDPYDYQL